MFAETEEALLLRVTVAGGRAQLRNHDVAVEQVLGMLAEGMTPEAIVRAHAGLQLDDVRACLVYARRSVNYAGAAPTIG
jgi:uncharacterized protein (DUF433 family)